MSAAVETRRQGRPRTPIEHGTEAGYQKHRRYGPPVDDADSCGCRRANREATYARIAAQGGRNEKPRQRVRKPPARRYTRTERAAMATAARHARSADDLRLLLEALGLAA